jgi:hypothetical protein
MMMMATKVKVKAIYSSKKRRIRTITGNTIARTKKITLLMRQTKTMEDGGCQWLPPRVEKIKIENLKKRKKHNYKSVLSEDKYGWVILFQKMEEAICISNLLQVTAYT